MLQQARPQVANPSAQPGRGRSFPSFSLRSPPDLSSTRRLFVSCSASLRNSPSVIRPLGKQAQQQARRMGFEGAQESRVQAWLGAGQLPDGLVGLGFWAGSGWLARLQRRKSLIACTINRYTYRDERLTQAPRLKAKAYPDRLTPGGAGEPLHPLLSPQTESRTR